MSNALALALATGLMVVGSLLTGMAIIPSLDLPPNPRSPTTTVGVRSVFFPTTPPIVSEDPFSVIANPVDHRFLCEEWKLLTSNRRAAGGCPEIGMYPPHERGQQ
jgi:hypothetical protein